METELETQMAPSRPIAAYSLGRLKPSSTARLSSPGSEGESP